MSAGNPGNPPETLGSEILSNIITAIGLLVVVVCCLFR